MKIVPDTWANEEKEEGKSPQEMKLPRSNKAAPDRESRVLSCEASLSVLALKGKS